MNSPEFFVAQPQIVAALGLSAAILLTCLQLRRRQSPRERVLESAVRERTEELQKARSRERSRARVLEMLVSNESLTLVLNSLVDLIREEVPGCICAVLLNGKDGWTVASAPMVPVEWLQALAVPHAIPFEVWKEPCRFSEVPVDPAWHEFMSRLGDPRPGAISSRPIGGRHMPLGALLVFDDRGDEAAGVLTSASRLAQLAIEHSRFYEDLKFQAHHDSLTGLPNRALFEERLSCSVRESEKRKGRLAVLFLDLDHFKQVNDTMNHRTGDLLLAEVADRLRRIVRPGDTVARIGGDEFNILLSNVCSAGEAHDIANRIVDAIKDPFTIEGSTINVSASVGISLYPDDSTDPDQLRRDADTAMYCAKGMGRNRVEAFRRHGETQQQCLPNPQFELTT